MKVADNISRGTLECEWVNNILVRFSSLDEFNIRMSDEHPFGTNE